MYNLLEKLRAGEPFTDTDRDHKNKALISILKQIYDDLDKAVLDDYSWPHTITDEQILENLVALNAERAEEERNGLIRWLPPRLSKSRAGTRRSYRPAHPRRHRPYRRIHHRTRRAAKWSTKPKEQLAAIHDLLRTTPGEWSAKQIAAQFKGRITQKKLNAIAETAIASNGSALSFLTTKAASLTGTMPKLLKRLSLSSFIHL